jgi:hypothetical protein
LGVLGLASIVYLGLAAPGYWRILTAGPLVALVFSLALALLESVTGLGLFRHRAWARISTLLISGVLIVTNVVIILAMCRSHAGAHSFIMSTSQVAIGAWWMVLFNAPSARSWFTLNAPTPT